MKLTILGTGTAIPQKTRTSPGYLISTSQHTYLFDIGPLAVHRMGELGIDFSNISTVFISHSHLDHILGLFHLLFVFKHPEYRIKKSSITIAGSSESISQIKKIIEACGDMIEPDSYHFIQFDPSVHYALDDEYSVACAPISHNASSLAYVLVKDNKKILVYTGDTDCNELVIEAAKDTQYLLMECSFPEEKKVANHLIPSECAYIASRASAAMTLLTHFYPEARQDLIEQQCSNLFTTDYMLLNDNQIIELSPT
jgi:ribonuclease BN (tRNA processing enzyme)